MFLAGSNPTARSVHARRRDAPSPPDHSQGRTSLPRLLRPHYRRARSSSDRRVRQTAARSRQERGGGGPGGPREIVGCPQRKTPPPDGSPAMMKRAPMTPNSPVMVSAALATGLPRPRFRNDMLSSHFADPAGGHSLSMNVERPKGS